MSLEETSSWLEDASRKPLRAFAVLAVFLVFLLLAAVATGLGTRIAEAVNWFDEPSPKPVREMALKEWFSGNND